MIDGQDQLLKTGQVSSSGVELVEANPSEAIVRINGHTRTWRLSARISSTFEKLENFQVHIKVTENRQYITAGSINGRPVRYIVDTGANVVVINGSMAKTLGLIVEEGIEAYSSAASDDIQVTMAILKERSVGEIKRRDVQAIIIDGENPKDILLGMTFLQHVDISERAGLMVLTSKL